MKIFKNININLDFIILMVCLFFASMNFANRYFYFLFFGIITFLTLNSNEIRVSKRTIILIILSFSLLFFEYSAGIKGIIKVFVYPLSYLAGLNCIKSRAGKEIDSRVLIEKQFIIIIMTMVGGTFIHVLLNLFVNFGSTSRVIYDFWVNGEVSATCVAALFVLGISVLPAIFFEGNGRLLKILGILITIVYIMFALILAGRTFFALILVAIMACYIYKVFISKKTNIKFLMVIMIFFLIAIIIYNNNIFNARDIIQKSNFFNRFFSSDATLGIAEDNRIDLKKKYFENMFIFENMWGNHALRISSGGRYAHELYLDAYSRYGIVTYLSLVFFVFSSTFKGFIFVFKDKHFSVFLKMIVLTFFITINIEFMMEPILEGVPWLFPIFCYICGMIDFISSLDLKIKNDVVR